MKAKIWPGVGHFGRQYCSKAQKYCTISENILV